MGLQAKMLRVLQEREVERVGGKKPIALDIRILSTSNRDMMREVQAGRFREDLFYRINVFPLAIPSLRERPADVLPLAHYFIERHGERIGKTAKIADDAAAVLAAWRWPGNVRELENTVQRAVIVAAGDTITADDVRMCLPDLAGISQMSPLAAPVAFEGASAGHGALERQSNQADGVVADKPVNMRDLERQHILETLKAVGGSRKKAVEKLGISERTLRYKLQQYREEGYTDP